MLGKTYFPRQSKKVRNIGAVPGLLKLHRLIRKTRDTSYWGLPRPKLLDFRTLPLRNAESLPNHQLSKSLGGVLRASICLIRVSYERGCGHGSDTRLDMVRIPLLSSGERATRQALFA